MASWLRQCITQNRNAKGLIESLPLDSETFRESHIYKTLPNITGPGGQACAPRGAAVGWIKKQQKIRQGSPSSKGAVCKMQCGKKNDHETWAPAHPNQRTIWSIAFYTPCLDLRCFFRAGWPFGAHMIHQRRTQSLVLSIKGKYKKTNH